MKRPYLLIPLFFLAACESSGRSWYGYPVATATPPANGWVLATAPPFPGSRPLSDSDRTLIQRTLTNMLNLHSYHFTLTTVGYPVSLTGDYTTPFQTYVHSNIGNEQMDQVWLGGSKFYFDPTSTRWIPFEDYSVESSTVSQSLLSFLLPLWGGFLSDYGTQFFVGDDHLNGIVVKHFYAKPDFEKSIPPTHLANGILINNVSIWIDLDTYHILKARVYYPGSGLSVRTSSKIMNFTQEDMTFSDFNDPRIKMPVMASPEPGK